MVKSVTVRAPCSTANLGPGFDVFGLALDAFYDEVTVTKKGKGITIVSSDDIPLDPKKNTAGLVGKAMMKDFVKRGIKYKNGIEVKIKKGVPAGYGVGSSAASAAACAIGINELFGEVFEDWELINYAGIGEKASAGTVHYDNVAASIIGGFVVVNPYDEQEIKFGGIQVIGFGPPALSIILGIPKIRVPKQKTKASRGVIPKTVKFSDASFNLANATTIAAAFAVGRIDSALVAMKDAIVEPARKKMIPGFDKVKKNAISAGATACTISGAGPTVIALVEMESDIVAKEVGEAMKKGFKSAKVDCDIVICKPSNGPEIVKVVK
jgi:homoserine kinase